MKHTKLFMRISVLVLLCAVTALTFLACAQDEGNPTGAEITLTIAVTNKAGETSEQEIKTTATNLGDALVEALIAEGTNDQYGLYIWTVNGETIAEDEQAYWAISKNGEALMTGASSTPIADSEHYEIAYTPY